MLQLETPTPLPYISCAIILDTDSYDPVIAKGDTLLLEKIAMEDFLQPGNCHYIIVFKEGTFQICEGRAMENGSVLRFYNIVTNYHVWVLYGEIETLFKICAILRPGYKLPRDYLNDCP